MCTAPLIHRARGSRRQAAGRATILRTSMPQHSAALQQRSAWVRRGHRRAASRRSRSTPMAAMAAAMVRPTVGHLCVDMCTGMYTDMCIGMCMDNLGRHAPINVHRHICVPGHCSTLSIADCTPSQTDSGTFTAGRGLCHGMAQRVIHKGVWPEVCPRSLRTLPARSFTELCTELTHSSISPMLASHCARHSPPAAPSDLSRASTTHSARSVTCHC